MSDSNIYSIPYRFRRVENLHILLWLIKDACWAVNFRVLGMIMIIPTLAVAVIITWQTRGIVSELLHNIVVALWITANCTWMVGEFYGWDENLWGPYGLHPPVLLYFPRPQRSFQGADGRKDKGSHRRGDPSSKVLVIFCGM